MKRILIAATISLFAAAPSAFAVTGTWTGKISDSMCGLTHKAMIEHGGGKMTDAQCTEACVKMRLAGEMQGATITVSSITTSKKKAAKK